MNDIAEKIRQIQPFLSIRQSGGWLATTPAGSSLCIGVVGRTEGDARERFADVFHFVDLEKDDEVGIRDAFRGYKPTGQQDRIVALFIGLCTAAGLIKERQKESKTNVRSTKPKIVQRKQSQPKRQAKNQTGRIPPALVGLLESLPPEGEGWAKARRDKFYETFGSVLDFCIPIVEQDSRQEDDEE